MIDLAAEISRSLDCGVIEMTPLGGGDVADSYRTVLEDGSIVFAKTKALAVPGFFVTEAVGLSWLREVAAVAVPEVLAVCDDPPFLILEWIDPGYASGSTDSDLGRELATLHLAGAPFFGREDRRTTTSRRLPNDPADTWSEFYAQQRLIPLARLCRDAGALPGRTVAALEDIARRIDDLVGPEEPPARLHGDLWAGNRLVGAGGVNWLIDPAAFGGHREFDLAMMRLFGGFSYECYAAYEEVHPLAEGWEQRIALHQLAPLAIHAIKFGGPYVTATDRALAQLR